jgi:hypothetical protein
MPINGFGWENFLPPGSEELAAATATTTTAASSSSDPTAACSEQLPVDKASCSYAVLWNAFKRIAAVFADDEKDAMFHDTATRVYRLGGK